MDEQELEQLDVNPVIKLSKEDFEAFLRALEAPPKNLPRLRKLFEENDLFDSEPMSDEELENWKRMFEESQKLAEEPWRKEAPML
jgi:hypothetical protein